MRNSDLVSQRVIFFMYMVQLIQLQTLSNDVWINLLILGFKYALFTTLFMLLIKKYMYTIPRSRFTQPSERDSTSDACFHWWYHLLFFPQFIWYILFMMTSSNGNIFRVTSPLCGEFTGDREIPAQRPATRGFDVFFDYLNEMWIRSVSPYVVIRKSRVGLWTGSQFNITMSFYQ